MKHFLEKIVETIRTKGKRKHSKMKCKKCTANSDLSHADKCKFRKTNIRYK